MSRDERQRHCVLEQDEEWDCDEIVCVVTVSCPNNADKRKIYTLYFIRVVSEKECAKARKRQRICQAPATIIHCACALERPSIGIAEIV